MANGLPPDLAYAPLPKSSLCAPQPLFSDKRALIDRHYSKFAVAFSTSASVAGIVTASIVRTSWVLGNAGIADTSTDTGFSGPLTQTQTSLGPDGLMSDDYPFLIKSISVSPVGLPYVPSGTSGAANTFAVTPGGNILSTYDQIAEQAVSAFYQGASLAFTTGGDCPQNANDISSYTAGDASQGGAVPQNGLQLYANVLEFPFYLRVIPSQIKQKALKYTFTLDAPVSFTAPDTVLPPSSTIAVQFKLEMAGRLLCGPDDGSVADPNGKGIVDAATPWAGTLSLDQMNAIAAFGKANGLKGF